MKQNLLVLVFSICLCAAFVGLSGGLLPDSNSLPASPVVPPKVGQNREATLREPPASPTSTATSTVQVKPASINRARKELTYVTKIEGGQVEFKLINKGSSPHIFYSDSLQIRGVDEVPGHAEVQVLKKDGSLFDAWDSHFHTKNWSPLLLSSDAGTALPAKAQVIQPNGTRSLTVPIKKFFRRSDFVPGPETEGYRIRVISNLYLNANLTQYIQSRSSWVAL